jgi:hypothetical protein
LCHVIGVAELAGRRALERQRPDLTANVSMPVMVAAERLRVSVRFCSTSSTSASWASNS